MWDDTPPEVKRQQDLWSAAFDLDVDRVKKALAEGAPPEPVIGMASHGRTSPLVRALESFHASSKKEAQRQIIDLLLDARRQYPELAVPSQALATALEQGNRWALDRLLPFYEQGIDTPLPQRTSRAVTYAIKRLDDPPRSPDSMSHMEVFEWVLAQNPSLDVAESLPYTQALEPLPFALSKYFSSSFSNGHAMSKPLYKRAVDALVERKAPLWIEGANQSWPAVLSMVRSLDKTWGEYLMTQLPEKHWDKVESRLGDRSMSAGEKEEVLAFFRQLRLESKLHNPQLPAYSQGQPPKPRF